MKTIVTKFALALGLGFAALTGCDVTQDVSFDGIRNNLTPELYGSVERKVDADRNMAVAQNMTFRMASDDWGRVWYTNRPSTLTVLPIVATSGMPN